MICYTILVFRLATTDGDCEDAPSDCVWNDQQKSYICDIVGVPLSDTVIRRLQLSRYVRHTKKVDHIRVTAPPKMKDIEISWNKDYITLFVSICMNI